MICDDVGYGRAPQRNGLIGPTGREHQDARSLADAVMRLRLAKLQHSQDDLAAAVATLGLLWLRRQV